MSVRTGVLLVAIVLAAVASGGAAGHSGGTTVNGSLLVAFPNSLNLGTFSTVRGLANTDLANGVMTWNAPVTGGDDFHLDDTCCAADFDVTFTGGTYVNGPGDEAGTVPGSGAGHATILLFFGPPGSTFRFHHGY